MNGSQGGFNLKAFSKEGTLLKEQYISFGGATSFVQLNLGDFLSSVSGDKTGITIAAETFQGAPISGYATIIDNVSGDAAFVQAQPVP